MITVVEVTREVARSGTASIVTSSRRVLGYPGPGGYTVSLVIRVAVSVAAVAVVVTAPLITGKAGSCLPR